MSLPSITSLPAGTNPYVVYSALLHAALYRPSPRLYPLRLYLLLALLSLVVALALAYIAVLFLDGRRRVPDGAGGGGGGGGAASRRPGPSKNMWLFRVARKSNEEGYIVTNAKLQAAVWAVVTGIVMIAALDDVKEVTLDGGPVNQFSGWRSFATVPLLVQAWLVTWGSLQAFILTTTQTDKRILSPRVVNGLFVGGGVVLFGGLVAAAVVNTLSGNSVWHEYVAIQARLATLAAGWSADQSPADQLAPASSLVPLMAHLTDLTNYARDTNIAALALLMAVPFVTAVVNVGSVLLARLVRKQLSFHIQQATTTVQLSMSQAGLASGASGGGGGGLGISSVQGAVPTVITFSQSFDGGNEKAVGPGHQVQQQTSTLESSQSHRSQGASGGGGGGFQPRKFSLAPAALLAGVRHAGLESSSGPAHSQGDALAAGVRKNHMSRHALRQLVTRRGSGAEVERARQIQALQRAEADLTTISAFVGALLAGITGLCAFTFIEYYNGQLATGPWGVYEVGLTGVYWVWGVSMLGGLGFLLWNAWAARHLDLTPALPEFVAASAYGPGGASAGPRRASSLTNPNGPTHSLGGGGANAAFAALSVPAEAHVGGGEGGGLGQTTSFGGYSMASRHDWERAEDEKQEEQEKVEDGGRGSEESGRSEGVGAGVGGRPKAVRRQTITFEH